MAHHRHHHHNHQAPPSLSSVIQLNLAFVNWQLCFMDHHHHDCHNHHHYHYLKNSKEGNDVKLYKKVKLWYLCLNVRFLAGTLPYFSAR